MGTAILNEEEEDRMKVIASIRNAEEGDDTHYIGAWQEKLQNNGLEGLYRKKPLWLQKVSGRNHIFCLICQMFWQKRWEIFKIYGFEISMK